ncbi:MAG: hypothetical protein NUW23_05180 [Firmicutes bacterium]|jgi:hypothetical protein|nr:hypothetical protein [Bacillota bacterium]
MNRTHVLARFICCVLVSLVGLAVTGSPPSEAAQTPQEQLRELNVRRSENRVNLYWTVEGLVQLEQSKNKKVNLTRQQAEKILPILEELVSRGVLQTELGAGEQATLPAAGTASGGSGVGGWGQGWGGGQGITLDDATLRKRVAEGIALEKFVEDCLARIDSILARDQVSFIDNLNFDPAAIGLGTQAAAGLGSQRGTETQPSQRQLEEAQKRRESLMKARVELVRKAMDLVRAKAGK